MTLCEDHLELDGEHVEAVDYDYDLNRWLCRKCREQREESYEKARQS